MEILLFVGLGALLVFFFIRSGSYNNGSRPVEAAPLDYASGLPRHSFAVRYNDPYTKKEVGIDVERNMVVFAHKDGRSTSHRFNDIVAVEAIKDGDSLSVTNRGSQLAGAAVGGLLLGPVGLLLGGLSGSRRNVEKVSKLSLRIVTNDIVSPIVELVFLDWPIGGGLTADQPLLKETAARMDEWYARFQTIVSRQMVEQETSEEPMRNVTPDKEPYRFKAID